MSPYYDRDNRHISQLIAEAYDEFSDLHAAAQLQEELKSAFVSELIQERMRSGMPVSRAEVDAKASPEYSDFIEGMVEARRKANKAKGRIESLRAQMAEWTSQEANNRVTSR